MNAKKWITPALPGENRMPARAHYIPYTKDTFSKEDTKVRSLDGTWDFRYYETIPEVPEKVKKNANKIIPVAAAATVAVAAACVASSKKKKEEAKRTSAIRRDFFNWLS